MDDDAPKYDSEDLEWVPAPGEELSVFTAEFCNIFGGCEHCKGIASAEQLRSCSKPDFIPAKIPDDQAVFCTHWCHEAMSEA